MKLILKLNFANNGNEFGQQRTTTMGWPEKVIKRKLNFQKSQKLLPHKKRERKIEREMKEMAN